MELQNLTEVVFNVGRLLIDLVRDPALFADMREEWNALMQNSDAGVFNSWEWLYPWYVHLGSARPLRILTARDESGALVGIMPLALHTMWFAGFKLRRLAFLGETHLGSDYLDVIARRDCREAVTQAFADALHKSGDTWDVLDLSDIGCASPTLALLRNTFADRQYRTDLTPGSVCPYEVFRPGETFESFLSRTSRRANFRRRKKWLEKQPGYALSCVTQPDQVAPALDELVRLHALRWEPEGGSQAISSPRVVAFHRDATRYLAERDRLRMFTMYIEGNAVASVYAIVHNGVMHYYQSGRDPRWKDQSVGLVLVGETFRNSIESGLRAYDFLQGREQFKSDWATSEKRTVGLRIYRPRGIAPWLGRREKAIRLARSSAKHLLPEAWKRRLIRLRGTLMRVK